jgi:CRP/FNR family transcriptional regulator, polysaccharide utilization system transcription regulator
MKKLYKIPFCENCDVRPINVFKNLTVEEMETLNYEKGCNFYKRGSILYYEGNHINGVYCILNGILKLFKTGMEGKEQIIRFAQSGDIIGFRSVLTGELACTTAKVIDDATVCFIPSATLITLVKSNSSFSMDLLQLTCKELGEANKFILDISQKTVRERLAEVLLILKDTFNVNNENMLQISLTREELANIVGTATESVIRLLSEFKADKLVNLEGRKIRILDIRRLQKIANM